MKFLDGYVFITNNQAERSFIPNNFLCHFQEREKPINNFPRNKRKSSKPIPPIANSTIPNSTKQ